LAFVGHTVSALMTIFANSFEMLYWGTFLYALSNGTVEAVINPAVATMFGRNKTHWLNILHAGWPGGLVLGGLLTIGLSYVTLPADSKWHTWQLQMAIVLIPTILYGLILLGQKFPVQERVAAGVSYLDMLKEFGWGSSYICFFLLIAGISQILVVAGVPAITFGMTAGLAVIPTVLFGAYVRSFGRPMFVFMLLIMLMLATTELGTDSWISDIMRSVLGADVDPVTAANRGTMFLVYTSFIMFVLRFFAGPIVHKVSPLGLLTICAGVAAIGLVSLANAGAVATTLILAATLYGFGKTFFWPTTLGVVSEQFPRGGALMLNAIAGVGMICVGTLGNPAIGLLQDQALDQIMMAEAPDLYQKVMVNRPGMFSEIVGDVKTVDQAKLQSLPSEDQVKANALLVRAKQGTLGKIAILPAIMFCCYVALLAYFRGRGGYKAQVLTGHVADDEEFTGGVTAPVR
jgi:MFS family permease